MTAEFSISSSSINLLFVLFSLFFWTTKFSPMFLSIGSAPPGTERGKKGQHFPTSLALREGAVVGYKRHTRESDGELKKLLLVKYSQRSFPLMFKPQTGSPIFRQFIPSTLWGTKVKNVSIFFCVPLLFFLGRTRSAGIANDSRWIVSSSGSIHNQMPQILLYTPIAQKRVKEKAGGFWVPYPPGVSYIPYSSEYVAPWWIRPLIAFYTLAGDEERERGAHIPDKQ